MNENEKDIWTFAKSLFEVVRLQQEQLTSLRRTLGHLSAGVDLIMRAAAGEDDASPSRRIDTEAARRAKAEIAELEKLFNGGENLS